MNDRILFTYMKDLVAHDTPLDLSLQKASDIAVLAFGIFRCLIDLRKEGWQPYFKGKNYDDGTITEVQRISRTVASEVSKKQEDLLVSDIRNHPVYGKASSLVSKGIISFVALPLAIGGEPCGLVYYDKDERFERFSEKDLSYLRNHRDMIEILAENHTQYLASLKNTKRAEHAVMSIGSEEFPVNDENFRLSLLIAKEGARFASPLLIEGPVGVGTSRLARAIHAESGREGKFIVADAHKLTFDIHLNEIEDSSELRAADDLGWYLLQADGGTLFLQNIHELPLDVQIKLEHYMDHGILVAGKEAESTPDARLIFSTSANLFELAENGGFRRSLYYRVSGTTLGIPPLAERKEDIIDLFRIFAARSKNNPNGRDFLLSSQVRLLLFQHDWSGNELELAQAVDQIMIRCSGNKSPEVLPEHLPLYLNPQRITATPRELDLTTEQINERAHIVDLLIKHKGNISKTAKELGVSRNTLYKRKRQYKIQSHEFMPT